MVIQMGFWSRTVSRQMSVYLPTLVIILSSRPEWVLGAGMG